MRKKVTVYFRPIEKIIEIDDELTEIEAEMELTRQIYDVLDEEILSEAEIDYWEGD